ncbi:MAG: hypothetical protein DRP73_05630, partial [Candidatus Omnitrophota bacterium]
MKEVIRKITFLVTAEIFLFTQFSWGMLLDSDNLVVSCGRVSGNPGYTPVDFELQLASGGPAVADVGFVLDELQAANSQEVPDEIKSIPVSQIITSDVSPDQVIITFGEQPYEGFLIAHFDPEFSSLRVTAIGETGSISEFETEFSDFSEVLEINKISEEQVVTRLRILEDGKALFTYKTSDNR